MEWDIGIDRGMPWQGEKDPYLVWLSEILLQQTRVEQGRAYYIKFKKKYPTVWDLAQAPEDEVMRLWQGLGYYSRCRNLLYTAKYIVEENNGKFPTNYKDLLALKGIGPYTAAAISSFAFGESDAVVDGNVQRVLSRIFGITDPIDDKKGKKSISALAHSCIEYTLEPGRYNQAIMNFGAIHCTPKNPGCNECPFAERCFAFQKDMVDELPYKIKMILKRKRYFLYFHIYHNNHLLLRRRIEKDIWQNLYDMPMIELKRPLDNTFQIEDKLSSILDNYSLDSIGKLRTLKQTLTHQKIEATYIDISLKKTPELISKPYLWVSRSSLDRYAFPKIVLDFLSI